MSASCRRRDRPPRSGALRRGILYAIALWVGCAPRTAPPPLVSYAVEERSIAEIQRDLIAGRVTSRELVERYIARVRAIDQSGPTLRSIIAINPRALEEASRLDRERAAGRVRGPLHGIPVGIKDNIESADPLPTTAGSLALVANVTGRDAPLVGRLRAAGAVILAKTNLSEWANIRSTSSTSGWSAVGGLTKNPYALDRNACGSSSGSGAAVAASLVAAAIGTETDGSITCPSSINGLVGVKPTVGLVSRRHIVPISSAQDTAGPMTRTVEDAAIVLAAIAGSDSQDLATRDADARRADYAASLSADALKGARLGVLRFVAGYDGRLDALFDRTLETLRGAGVTVVNIGGIEQAKTLGADEMRVLLTDFRAEINAYLASTPKTVTTRTLTDVIAFNKMNAAREMPHFQQELFEQAEATATHDPHAYQRLRAGVKAAAGSLINRTLAAHQLTALIAPTTGPAWLTDLERGDQVGGSAAELPAVAGYPHVTVPMGFIDGLPVGLSIIGPAWSEATLLSLAYAFEQRVNARRPPTFAASAIPAHANGPRDGP
ncbi:MAG: amidase [Acidimicrobiia bacterium]|nr:amidase [Acidimicrobiia bacterium]